MGKPITHKHILKQFGQKLQKLRQSKGITQEELAAMLSMHRTYIGLIERGERNPTVRTLYKMAKALKVSSDKLLPF
ncbi:MAG: helix-turn-helix transcriptional regulator [Candidatus Daviesbacteria bacterium]|nr:helix-turn-helix transcriptional regulator [Candidatus Daviesbacteria bacterium]